MPATSAIPESARLPNASPAASSPHPRTGSNSAKAAAARSGKLDWIGENCGRAADPKQRWLIGEPLGGLLSTAVTGHAPSGRSAPTRDILKNEVLLDFLVETKLQHIADAENPDQLVLVDHERVPRAQMRHGRRDNV